jgi:hypothetical protein
MEEPVIIKNQTIRLQAMLDKAPDARAVTSFPDATIFIPVA